MTTLQLKANVPVILSLSNPEGELDRGMVHYQLSDGRTLSLSTFAAGKLNALELQPGEKFGICKNQQTPRELVHYTVWLAPESEKARAEQERPDIERQLAASIEQARAPMPIRRTEPIAAELGTGTHGPAPIPRPKSDLTRPPGRIPYNVAFKEITQFVVEDLKTLGVKWDPQSEQDAVSTIFIAAAKQGLLSLWERAA